MKWTLLFAAARVTTSIKLPFPTNRRSLQILTPPGTCNATVGDDCCSAVCSNPSDLQSDFVLPEVVNGPNFTCADAATLFSTYDANSTECIEDSFDVAAVCCDADLTPCGLCVNGETPALLETGIIPGDPEEGDPDTSCLQANQFASVISQENETCHLVNGLGWAYCGCPEPPPSPPNSCGVCDEVDLSATLPPSYGGLTCATAAISAITLQEDEPECGLIQYMLHSHCNCTVAPPVPDGLCTLCGDDWLSPENREITISIPDQEDFTCGVLEFGSFFLNDSDEVANAENVTQALNDFCQGLRLLSSPCCGGIDGNETETGSNETGTGTGTEPASNPCVLCEFGVFNPNTTTINPLDQTEITCEEGNQLLAPLPADSETCAAAAQLVGSTDCKCCATAECTNALEGEGEGEGEGEESIETQTVSNKKECVLCDFGLVKPNARTTNQIDGQEITCEEGNQLLATFSAGTESCTEAIGLLGITDCICCATADCVTSNEDSVSNECLFSVAISFFSVVVSLFLFW